MWWWHRSISRRIRWHRWGSPLSRQGCSFIRCSVLLLGPRSCSTASVSLICHFLVRDIMVTHLYISRCSVVYVFLVSWIFDLNRIDRLNKRRRTLSTQMSPEKSDYPFLCNRCINNCCFDKVTFKKITGSKQQRSSN
jgi:hypothetical protein